MYHIFETVARSRCDDRRGMHGRKMAKQRFGKERGPDTLQMGERRYCREQ